MKIIYHIKHPTFTNVHTILEFANKNVLFHVFLTSVYNGYKIQTPPTTFTIKHYNRLTKKEKSENEKLFFLMQGKFLDCFLQYTNQYNFIPLKRADGCIVW